MHGSAPPHTHPQHERPVAALHSMPSHCPVRAHRAHCSQVPTARDRRRAARSGHRRARTRARIGAAAHTSPAREASCVAALHALPRPRSRPQSTLLARTGASHVSRRTARAENRLRPPPRAPPPARLAGRVQSAGSEPPPRILVVGASCFQSEAPPMSVSLADPGVSTGPVRTY